jgi:hypothetical protein
MEGGKKSGVGTYLVATLGCWGRWGGGTTRGVILKKKLINNKNNNNE